MHDLNIPKIVVMGGGTGTFTVLSGLKKYPVDLTAIVTMADDGGSTGRLRDEFGVLPPGDLRQCLVALSDGSDVLRKLFNHRFEKGELKGHSFGNLFISTLEQVTGNLDHALTMAGEILKIRGNVVPVTLDKIRLVAELKNGKMLYGEGEISNYQLVSRFGIKRIYLEPRARANPRALQAVEEADVIVIGPGNLYSSLLPNFLVEGIKQALVRSRAKKVYVASLMNKHGHTDNFTIEDYVREIEGKLQRGIIEVVIYNTKKPPSSLLRKYADEGEPVRFSANAGANRRTFIGTNFLAQELYKKQKADMLRRTLIRHDPDKLAKKIMALL